MDIKAPKMLNIWKSAWDLHFEGKDELSNAGKVSEVQK
jgi:hypothetical protein